MQEQNEWRAYWQPCSERQLAGVAAGRPQRLCCGKDFGFTVSKKESHQRVLRRQMTSVVKGFPDSVGQKQGVWSSHLGTSHGCDQGGSYGCDEKLGSWHILKAKPVELLMGWMWVWEKEKSQRWLRPEQLEGSSWDQLWWGGLQVNMSWWEHWEGMFRGENGKKMHMATVHSKTRETDEEAWALRKSHRGGRRKPKKVRCPKGRGSRRIRDERMNNWALIFLVPGHQLTVVIREEGPSAADFLLGCSS